MNLKKYFLILLFVTSFMIRVYHVGALFFWHIDEDTIALTVKRIIIEHHIQLIGFPVPGNIYLGPLFFYLTSVFYFVSKMNPFGLPLFAAIFGTISTFLVYKVGSIIFEKKSTGVFSALVFGLSFLVNVYSKVFSGLTFGPIYALLVYLFIYRNIKNKKPTNLILLGLVLLLAIQNEGSSISLLILVFASWVIYKFKFPAKDMMIIFVIFVVFHLPLLVFDLRHNFLIANSLLAFFLGHDSSIPKVYSFDMFASAIKLFPVTLSRFLFIPSPADIGEQIHPCIDLVQKRLSEISLMAIFISVLIIAHFVGTFTFGSVKTIGQKIVFLHLIILVIGLLTFNIFQNGYLYEWVLVIFFPGFALMIGYFLSNLWGKRYLGQLTVILFLILFVFFNIKAALTSTGRFGLNDKAEATKWAIKSIGGKPFFLDSIGSCFNYGYVYLFWYFGNQPVATYADYMFTPTFYTRIDKTPAKGVVMINPSYVEDVEFWKKYSSYKNKATSRKQFGNIEVLIVDEGI